MIEDVINEVRELFLDEGVDEQVLLELKTVTGLIGIEPVLNDCYCRGVLRCLPFCSEVYGRE